MAVIVANKFGVGVLKALGVDPSLVTEFVIRGNCWDAPTAEITFIVDDGGHGLLEVVKKYTLTPAAEEEDAS